mgnify:CR=1 FL=1
MGENRGFTLIELMVTIAVLAIIASIAAPSFSEIMSNRQLLSVTRVMSESLNEARGRAAVMKATVVVCPNKKSDDSEFTKKDCVDNTISGADSNKYILQNRVILVQVPKKVKVSSSDLGVVFTPTGAIQAKKTFTFCINGNSQSVEISMLGALNQTKGTC